MEKPLKTRYDSYNREERSLCAHLFRLLHEPAREGRRAPLDRVIEHLGGLPLEWNGPARIRPIARASHSTPPSLTSPKRGAGAFRA